MAEMPRPRPPYLHHEHTRHGAGVWYVRKGKGPRTRIREQYGTPEFWEAYDAAVSGRPLQPKAAGASLAWLIGEYRKSSDWAKLKPATHRQRVNIFNRIIVASGDVPFSAVTPAKIAEGVERRSKTPFAANNYLKSMRGLFAWAMKGRHVETDPTANIEGLSRRTEGFLPWTDEDIERFEARWPVGTRERLGFAILLYTGLRRGDAAKLGRQHVRDDTITVRTEKNGAVVEIPLLPELAEVIAGSKTGDLAFVATPAGAPMTKESFGNWFREACDEAKVRKSAHGLRKTGATRLANNGANEAALEAIFGWSGGRMAALYTKAANRKSLAKEHMAKMRPNKNQTSIPAPGKRVRASDE